MSDTTLGIKLTFDGKPVEEGIGAVNAQLRAMAEKAKTTSSETHRLFEPVARQMGEVASQATRAAGAVAANSKAIADNASFLATHSNSIRNASYQLTDFAVQVQNGTKVSVALGQQLPQLLAGFGTLGVVAGLAASIIPTLAQTLLNSAGDSKTLTEAMSDLNKAIGDVGGTVKSFDMEKLYEEFNKANGATRAAIIEQLNFQRVFIETSRLVAEKKLGESLTGLGSYGTLDKLAGAYASSSSDKLAGQLGISPEVAKDLMVTLKGLKAGTEDVSLAFIKFGTVLAGGNEKSRELASGLANLSKSERDGAAALTAISEAQARMAKGYVQTKKDMAEAQKSAAAAQKQADELEMQRLEQLARMHKMADAELAAMAKQEEEYFKALAAGSVDLERHASELERQVEFYGMTESAIQNTIVARLEETRTIAADNGAYSEHLAYLDREIEARKRIAAAADQRDFLDASKKGAAESSKAWEKFADDIERSLTDSLYRAFESGDSFGEAFAKSLQNTFKSMVLKVAVQGVVGSVTGALGIGSGSNGGSSGGLLGDVSNASSLAGLFGGASVGASAASIAAANVSGAVGGDAIGTLIEANTAKWAVEGGAVGGLSGALGTLAAAAPYIAAAVAVYSIASKYFGGGGGPKDTSYYGNDPWEGKATGGSSAGAMETLVMSSTNAINAIAAAYGQAGPVAYQAGYLSADPAGDAATQLGVNLRDASGGMLYSRADQYGGNIENVGRSSEELQAAMADTLRDSILIAVEQADIGTPAVVALFDQFAGSLGDLSAERADALAVALTGGWLDELLASVDETAIGLSGVADAALKLASVAQLKPIMDAIGVSFFDMGAQLAAALGGVDNANAALSSYYDNFFTAEEKRAKTLQAITDVINSAGGNVTAETIGTETRAEWRATMESLDLTTDAGQRLYAAMLSVSGAFASVSDAAITVSTAVETISETMKGLQSDRTSLERELALAQGTDVRTLDIAGMSEAEIAAYDYNAALREQIQTLNDAATAAQDAAAAEAERIAAVTREAANLQQQYDLITGVTTQREIELAALDESNQALQLQIWALQDAATAAEAAARAEADRQAEIQRAAEEAARAEAQRIADLQRALEEAARVAAQAAAQIASERYGLETQLLQLQGNTAALRERELAQLDESNRALQQQIWALEDQAAAADEAAKAADAAAKAAEETARTWRNLADSLLEQARKIRGELTGDSVSNLQAQFAIATAAARSGDQAAAGRLVGLSDSLLSAYSGQAASAVDYKRMQAYVASSLEGTAGYIDPNRGTDAAASEIKALREENKAQAATMARLLGSMDKLYSRWDRDGLPATRVEV